MKLTATETAARLVISEITRDRSVALQISLAKLAEICVLHGLFGDLPPLASGGLEKLWRDRITQTLGATWTIKGRSWRVSCPWGGNYRLEPIQRKRTKR
jgi:hypothetical protein